MPLLSPYNFRIVFREPLSLRVCLSAWNFQPSNRDDFPVAPLSRVNVLAWKVSAMVVMTAKFEPVCLVQATCAGWYARDQFPESFFLNLGQGGCIRLGCSLVPVPLRSHCSRAQPVQMLQSTSPNDGVHGSAGKTTMCDTRTTRILGQGLEHEQGNKHRSLTFGCIVVLLTDTAPMVA